MSKSAEFEATFDTLRRVLKPYEKDLAVVADEPGRYYLKSRTARNASGSAIWFGGVEIRKSYVSFHLIPVYADPKLLKKASPSLLKRMQGKSCFNFTSIDPAHVDELSTMTRKGFDGFVKRFS